MIGTEIYVVVAILYSFVEQVLATRVENPFLAVIFVLGTSEERKPRILPPIVSAGYCSAMMTRHDVDLGKAIITGKQKYTFAN